MSSGYNKDSSFSGKIFIKGYTPWNKGIKTRIKPTNAFEKGHPCFVKRKGIYKICPICKKEFYTPQSLKRINYCSTKCLGISNRGRIPWNKGMIGIFVREKAMNWQGGKSFEEYGKEFDSSLKEQIRFRDNYKCRICGCSQVENRKQLDVHHINYNKKNIEFNNLISLCKRCHMKTNGRTKRDYWLNYFKDLILKKDMVSI